MAGGSDIPPWRVILQPDGSEAELVLRPDLAADACTEDACVAALRQAGVRVDKPVLEAVRRFLAQVAAGGDRRAVVARATPPRHGQDGAIDWVVQATRDDPNLSHYQRCAFTMVRPQQVLGRLIPPTLGSDGADVTGRTLAARNGQPVALKHDESILVNAQGELVAQTEGALDRTGPVLRVRHLLQVAEHVDFSTGNIDFNGDVQVGRGIRDLFKVRAGGNLEVQGVIEAAHVECGANLMTVGFAGRDRGTARVGGSLLARYLDNVGGEIGQDLVVEKSIVNCDFTVHGAIKSPRAALIGGRCVVTGPVELDTLGSDFGVATELVLGRVPRLDQIADRLGGLVDKVAARHQALLAEQRQINADSRNKPAALRERLTELAYELDRTGKSLVRGQGVQEQVKADLAALRTVRVLVHGVLHAGSLITVSGRRFRITDDVRGPLVISRDRGELVYAVAGGKPALLAHIAEVQLAA